MTWVTDRGVDTPLKAALLSGWIRLTPGTPVKRSTVGSAPCRPNWPPITRLWRRPRASIRPDTSTRFSRKDSCEWPPRIVRVTVMEDSGVAAGTTGAMTGSVARQARP